MKNKTTSSAPKEIVKDARKQGRRDGKNQVPRQEWGQNSVPYLMQLQRQYAAFGRELDLELEEKKLAKEAQKVNAIRTEIQEKGKSNALAANLAKAEEELAIVQAKLDGGVEEVPMAKFARIRQIGNTFYLPFLFLLFIGEFTISYWTIIGLEWCFFTITIKFTPPVIPCQYYFCSSFRIIIYAREIN